MRSQMKHFIKIVRLTTIRNGVKLTIFTNNELRRLLMISKSNIEQCANENTGPDMIMGTR